MKRRCTTCGSDFDHLPWIIDGKDVFADNYTCEICEQENEAHQVESKRIESVKKEEERKRMLWIETVPEEYRDTLTTHQDYPHHVHKAAMLWLKNRFTIKEPETRLFFGLIGGSGLCKTRVVSQMVKRLIWHDHRPKWMNAYEFQWSCQNQFSKRAEEAEKNLRSYLDAEVLIFDDLGALKSTETIVDNFYRLLEHRKNKKMPMIWTSNETIEDEILSGIPSPKARMRVISRLAGHSTTISI